MPERVADAIEEITRPNRDDQQEKPQIQADPALRRPALSIAGQPRVCVVAAVVAAVVIVGLLAWAFRPIQTLRRGARTWVTAARRRRLRIPLIGSLAAAVVIGVGLAALATWIISGAAFEHAAPASDIDVVGYLRLPYEPDSGSNHLSEFVSTTTWSATPPAVNIEETRRQAMRQNDRAIQRRSRLV